MSVFHNNALIGSGASAVAAATTGLIKSVRFNSDDSAYLNRTPSSAGNRRTFTFAFWIKKVTTSTSKRIFNCGPYTAGTGYRSFNLTSQGGTPDPFYMWDYSGSYKINLVADAAHRDDSAWYHLVWAVDTTQATESDRVKLYINGTQFTNWGTGGAGAVYPAQNYETGLGLAEEMRIGVRENKTSEFLDGYLADFYYIDGSALDATSFGAFDDSGVWQAAAYSGTYGTNGFHLFDFANESTVGNDSSGNENDFTANNISTTAGAGNDVLFDVPTNGTQSDTGAGGEVSGNYATLNPLTLGNATLSNGNLDCDIGASNGKWGAASTIGVTSGKFYIEVKCVNAVHGNTQIGIGDSEHIIKSHATEQVGTEGQAVYYRSADGNKRVYTNGSSSDGSYGNTYTQNDIIGIALNADDQEVTFYKNGTAQNSGTAISIPTTSQAIFLSLAEGSSQGPDFECNFGQRAYAYSAPSGYKALCTTNLPTATVPDGSDYFDTKLWTGGLPQNITGFEFSPDSVWIKGRSAANGHSLQNTITGTGKYLQPHNTNAEASDTTRITAFNNDGFSIGNSTEVNNSNNTFCGWAWDAGANSSKTYTVKVVSDNGNKYRFDDFGTSAVTLDLEEGSTYVFDQSDSSNSGHPLRFSTTSDGTHGSGSEYTTGVTTTGTPGSAGAKTTIVVAASAPTLYYYCSAHSGMGGQANTNSTAGASNFDGSLQATVRANQTAGFSIMTVTVPSMSSATIGHGLNAAPAFYIWKDRDTASTFWYAYHSSLGASKYMLLSSTNGAATLTTLWNNTDPTSSVINIGSAFSNSGDVVVWAFAPVAGYSAFSTYTGNGSATDGPFVYTGFRVAYLVLKRHDGSGDWTIWDSTRSTSNPLDKYLFVNGSSSEQTLEGVDFLSNGFKLRTNSYSNTFNGAGAEYIYAAFAENPFQANGGLAR